MIQGRIFFFIVIISCPILVVGADDATDIAGLAGSWVSKAVCVGFFDEDPQWYSTEGKAVTLNILPDGVQIQYPGVSGDQPHNFRYEVTKVSEKVLMIGIDKLESQAFVIDLSRDGHPLMLLLFFQMEQYLLSLELATNYVFSYEKFD